MPSSKPVTVWVAFHRDKSGICIPSGDQAFWKRSELTPCRYRNDDSNYARRFVAIDSLPEPLRTKVRKACR